MNVVNGCAWLYNKREGIVLMDYYNKYYLDIERVLDMIKSAIIVFDTSALLDLYYYSDNTKNTICTTVFEYLNGRMWIPGQVYFEFLKNKEKVRNKPIQSYESLISSKSNDRGFVDKIQGIGLQLGESDIKKIQNQLKTLREEISSTDKHPYLSDEVCVEYATAVTELTDYMEGFREKTNKFVSDFKNLVECKKSEMSNDMDDISLYISEKMLIGEELSYEDMIEIAKEGAFRYSELIPPGYMDQDSKEGLQKYGDLFVWKQILKHALSQNNNVLLVTNDVKKDWHDNENSAPRYELLREFNSLTHKNFWSCTMKDFLYLINNVLEAEEQISENVIQEVDKVITERPVEEREDDYEQILQEWLFSEADYQIVNEISISEEIRIFGNVRLYEGIAYDNSKYLILLNIMTSNVGYAKTLHAIQNIFEIKKFYEKQGMTYKYSQFALTVSNDAAIRMCEHLEKPNPRKNFKRKGVKNSFGYINGEREVRIIKTNYAMG